MLKQAPSSIIMVRPASFGYNPQTASSNSFQYSPDIEESEIHEKALKEFDSMVLELQSNNIEVIVIEDTESPVTPDAIFPNNWFSTHHDGQVILYPMEAINRREERRSDILDLLKQKHEINFLKDLSVYEREQKYLEGTGSIVFDHNTQKAYACRSSRTHEGLFNQLCNEINYTPIIFDAVDQQGSAIYHTNVMMCIATDFVIVCLESINEEDQEGIIEHLQSDRKQLIAIGYEQMNSFAGNMLEVENFLGERFLAMSKSAFQSLVNGQINAITKSVDIITLDASTIEQYGGGGVRCMMAGVHLPKI